MTKTFRVVSVSKNANSFGLHGHILVARDGTAFEVARSRGEWNTPWNKGADVVVPYEAAGATDVLDWAGASCEIPRALPTAPRNVLNELFGQLKPQ